MRIDEIRNSHWAELDLTDPETWKEVYFDLHVFAHSNVGPGQRFCVDFEDGTFTPLWTWMMTKTAVVIGGGIDAGAWVRDVTYPDTAIQVVIYLLMQLGIYQQTEQATHQQGCHRGCHKRGCPNTGYCKGDAGHIFLTDGRGRE